MSEIHRISFSAADIALEVPQPYPNIVPLALPKDLITIESESIFPIATTSTLPTDFYEKTRIDGRYTIDGERLRFGSRLEDAAYGEKDPGLQRLIREVEPHFSTLVIQPDYITHLFKQLDHRSEKFEDIPTEDKYNFFRPFAIQDLKTAQELNIRLFSVPEELWCYAFSDPGTTHDVLESLKDLNLLRLADPSAISSLLTSHGIDLLHGEAKITALQTITADVQALADTLHARELTEASLPASESQVLRDARVTRKRDALDCIDGSTYAASVNHGVIAPIDYLFISEYEILREEPLATTDKMWRTVRHVLSGFPQFGNDHTFLYRNIGSANTRTGVPPDYAVSRPGNFLAHDFKLLEHGPERHNFEFDHLFEFLMLHYFEGMNTYTTPNDTDPGSEVETDAYVVSAKPEVTYYTPMYREANNVIPFRAMKKDFQSTEYFEYGAECYLAELVDVALQMDLIRESNGAPSTEGLDVGNQHFGTYARKLVERVYLHARQSDAKLLIRQLLFTRGLSPIEDVLLNNALVDKLSELKTAPLLDSVGNQEPAKPPLTCAYYWFQRYARPVSKDELRQKGIMIKPALF